MNRTAPYRRAAGTLGAAGLVLIGLMTIVGPARAEDRPDPLNDPWMFSFGMYAVDASTDVSLDGSAGERGTKINWEDTFGGGTLTRFRVDAQWRFAERHKLQAMWFSSSRSDTTTLERDIDWGGDTYPVDAKVKGQLDYDIYLLTYEYGFMRRPTYELSASIGAYYASWDAQLSADFQAPGDPQSVKHHGDANLSAPLPVLGLHGEWVLPYDFSIDVSGRWFYLSVNQYSGNLQDYVMTLTWQPRAWLGLGVGYDWFMAHGDVDQSDFRGSLDWNFDGLMLFYRASF